MFLSRVTSLFCAAVVLLCAGSASAATPDSAAFSTGEAPFSVRFGDEVIHHRIMAVTALPNASVRVEAEPNSVTGFRVEGPEASTQAVSGHEWQFSAPAEPGLYPLTIRDTTSNASVQLQVFVLRTWDHQGQSLDGYRIGQYQMDPRRGLKAYEPPSGFIEVTDENKDVRVAPNFRLEQFLCKQTDETPQYVLLRTHLLQRLERVLATLNDRGHEVPTLHVMSGFRTPHYNRAIGNTTEYSRHLYGDAADVFVDTNGDQWMDDLNGDGRVTEADARYLASIVEDVPTPGDDRFNGGLSTYKTASHRGPFVHVDLRGHRARW